jgi:tetratricopeptide (TPR) repeat protein
MSPKSATWPWDQPDPGGNSFRSQGASDGGPGDNERRAGDGWRSDQNCELGVRRAIPWLLLCLTIAVEASARAAASADPFSAVRAALAEGRADDAIAQAQKVLAGDPNLAEAHNLLCRVFYQEERWDDGIAECAKATALADRVSAYHWWLARAYGEKADRVSFVQAYKLSHQVRGEFERAVDLDGRNAQALSDLGEFYTEAPAIAGGGLGKAESVAVRLDSVDSERAHTLRAGIANHRKDYPLAENQFKAAIAVSRNPADAWIALASFYRRRQRNDDMMSAIQSGVATDRGHDSALVDAASLLSRTGLNFPLAIQLLQRYLASPHKVEDAPAFQVHLMLSRLLAKNGDTAGAQREAETALSLAHDYKPALAATNTGR